MRKLILAPISLLVLLQSNISVAEEPHIVSTPDCPVGQTCCPVEIYCSYKEGCGDSDFWYVNGVGINPFDGIRHFSLTLIDASKWKKNYSLNCIYGSLEPRDFIGLVDYTDYKLNGSWIYSGFMNSQANCSTNNPLDCTGTKASQVKANVAQPNSCTHIN